MCHKNQIKIKEMWLKVTSAKNDNFWKCSPKDNIRKFLLHWKVMFRSLDIEYLPVMLCAIWHHSFVQFKKRKKHLWRSITFKPANLLKLAYTISLTLEIVTSCWIVAHIVMYYYNNRIGVVCDRVELIETLGRVHFWRYLVNGKSFGHETWPTSRYSHAQYF